MNLRHYLESMPYEIMEYNSINILEGVKKAHLIGIGGIGMSGIADYLLGKGITVTGSDAGTGSITDRLKKNGAEIFSGHKPENIASDVDIVIYSSAIKQMNPEIKEADKRKIRKIRRAEMLGSIVNRNLLIAVSGTHGKTTTTSIIAKILIDAGTDPTVFVGGNLDFLEGSSSRIGMGNIAVVEADEYDRSFLTLKADIIIINNLELDHTDIYSNLDDVKTAFTEFYRGGKKDLIIIANADDDNTMSILENNSINNEFSEYNVKTFGKSSNADYRIENILYSQNETQFCVNFDTIENTVEEFKLIITGEHNIYNATAALAACSTAGTDMESIKTSLSAFTGLKRRLELKYTGGVKIYDDYAHHPTEILKTFKAVKKLAQGRIITIFQPHTFTRTLQFYKDFAFSLRGNDIVFLTKLYPAREPEIDGVSSSLIFNEINESTIEKKSRAYYYETNTGLLEKLSEVIMEGDTVIFQGAGDINLLCEKFINDYLIIK